MTSDDLLKADYEHFADSYWRNEEIGEKRVSYFVSLITAVLTALVTLIATGFVDFSSHHARLLVTGLLSALLVLGLVTYLRMLHRNNVADRYLGVLGYIRCFVRKTHPAIAGYRPPIHATKSRWFKGKRAAPHT